MQHTQRVEAFPFSEENGNFSTYLKKFQHHFVDVAFSFFYRVYFCVCVGFFPQFVVVLYHSSVLVTFPFKMKLRREG